MRYLCDGEDGKWWDSNTVPKLGRQLLEPVNVRGNLSPSWPALAEVGATLVWAAERWNANARGEKPLQIKAGSPVCDIFPKMTATFDSLGKAVVWTLLIFEEIMSILKKIIVKSMKFVLVALSSYKYTKHFSGDRLSHEWSRQFHPKNSLRIWTRLRADYFLAFFLHVLS